MDTTTQQAPDVGDTGRQLRPDNEPGHYRTRPVEVTAVQFTGTGESCTAITKFFGGSSRGDNHQWKPCTNDGGWVINPGTRTEFRPGYWIIRDDGFYEAFSDTAFRAQFEAAGDA